MSDPVTLPLTPAQVLEFRRLEQQFIEAQKTVAGIPFARNYAARAIVLGHYSIDQFDGQHLAIDLDTATISVQLNGPQAVE